MAAGFHSTVDPKIGTCTLWFFRDIERDAHAAVTFKMTGGRPWHKSGRRPFNWDYLDPSGEREYGIIMLAVARTVRIQETEQNLPPFPIPGTFLITVQVYRLQSDDLLPQAEENFNFQKIAGQPIRWYQSFDPFFEPEVEMSFSPRHDHATIQPYPRGVQIHHDGGNWKVGLSAPANEPAAFAFDVSSPQVMNSYTISVVRSSNVKLSGGRVIRQQPPSPSAPPSRFPVAPPKKPRVPPVVQVLDHVTHLRNVPPQGTPLDPNLFAFSEWTEFEEWLSPSDKKSAIIIETVIGFIPYVGAIYDIAQLAYAATTGKNFWGETMHEMDYVVLGVVAVLPVAFAARQFKPALQSLSRNNRLFKAALSETTTVRLTERIDREFLEALKQVPLRQQEEIVASVENLAKGTGSARQVLKQFDDAVRSNVEEVLKKFEVASTFERHADRLVEDSTFKEAVRSAGKEGEFYAAYRLYKAGGADVQSVLRLFDDNMAGAAGRFKDEQRLLSVFTDDFKGFRTDPLKARYTAYVTKEQKTLTAVEWAKAQKIGQYRRALEAALGKEYVELINKTLGKRFIYEVGDAERRAFFNIVESGKLQTYADIRRAVKKFSIGRLFEVDHIFEKRFLKSIRVEDEVLDEADFFALLIPKNPAVARQLPEFAGGYAHSVKTQMLRDLIPHGSEDLFSVQQWWDAHVFVLKKLGADPAVYMKKFADTFADVAASAKQPFLARFSQTEEFFAPAKWLPRGPKTTLPIRIPKQTR